MKFHKAARISSPRMELLSRRPSTGRMSSFKRSKSFRASVKLITKIRSHANLRITSEYNLSPIALNPKGEESPNSRNTHISLVTTDLKSCFGELPEMDFEKGSVESEEEQKIATDLELKLTLGNETKGLKDRRKNDERIIVKSSEYNSYENPTFLDSSLDNSVSSFFHEVDIDGPREIADDRRPESLETEQNRRSGTIDNELTVIVETSKECEVHNWCTRTKGTNTKHGLLAREKWASGENEENMALAVKHRSIAQKLDRKREKARYEESSAKVSDGFSKSLKPRTVDNIASLWNGTRGSSFRVKRTGRKKQDSRDLESAIGFQHHRLTASASESKLHSLEGMEFLEGFGKKKLQLQQHQRHHHHQQNNLSSIRINSLTAQPSLNIHLHALFTAIEHGQVDEAKSILKSSDVDVNSLNTDRLSPLDVAVLSSNRPLAKMLVACGAQDGNHFETPESVGHHLSSLLAEAEHRIQELGGSTISGSSATLLEPPPIPTHRGSFSAQHNNLTGCSGNAEDKQLPLWERRARLLRKMVLGFNEARPPDIPFLATLDVTGTSSVTVRFHESDAENSSFCTRFKIQWSVLEDFSIPCEHEVLDMKLKEYRIDGLAQGRKYYFRVAAGNLKGYSSYKTSTPPFVIPSSWRDVDGRMPRFDGRLKQLDALFSDIRGPEFTQETPAVQRRNHKKKTTIKQLFTATSKFQKNLRRGVFLACLLYHDDKILVTNEDFLPVIEVDETYPSCISNDFNWLMKVACTWDDVKSLRHDMEKGNGSSTNHFRIKLLQAAAQMQATLGTQDLGQLYHKPIRDMQGTFVFSAVNCVRSPKDVSVLNSRWLPISKLTKKAITHDDSNVAEILMASLVDQITYHKVSSITLSRGLYLGYLKMQSSVDSIKVVVPATSPNVLPHCKIRDNPHVSADEWDYLKRITRLQALDPALLKESEEKENASNEAQGTEQQKLFIDLVAASSRKLFNQMDIGPDHSLIHRLYDAEVIELTSDVSFLIAVPPAETVCSVPGTREILLQREDLLSLPIQVFEMVHLSTYQKEMMSKYSRLSCIIELDTTQAQHNHREAFSTLELNVAKDRLSKLQDLQAQVNAVWKGARWLIDVITFARDRSSSQPVVMSSTQPTIGICMKHLLSLDRNKNTGNSLKRSLLQIPPKDPKLVKQSPGRGSWPGPSVTNTTITSEFSKSEQQLPSGQYVRKGSNTSNCSTASEPYGTVSAGGSSGGNLSSGRGSMNHLMPLHNTRLLPSKSEDTLLIGKYKKSPRNRSATITSTSVSMSPVLNVKTPMGTSSFLSVSNLTSDSMRSISSDEFSSSSKHGKAKISKPTASVAAIATSSNESQLEEEKDEATSMPAPLPGILQVYAAYETGLASGTSLKLHVTPRTTAREVVDLVVNRLNMAVMLKDDDGPIYPAEELGNFCLVAVIGARERCLRDDFKPLQLQNPWKKGRLYVRQKQDVLAALEHSSKHTAYL